MPKWKITTQDEVANAYPDRQLTIEAVDLDEAAEKAAELMQPWEKVATVEPSPIALPSTPGDSPV